MAVLTINGSEMPSPSKLEIQYHELGKTSTNAAGNAIMDVLGQKRSMNVSWSYLPKDRANDIVTAVLASHFMMLEFYDPKTGGNVSAEFYVSSMSFPAFRYENGVPVAFKDCKIAFQER